MYYRYGKRNRKSTEIFSDGVSYIDATIPMPPVETERKGMSIEQIYGCRVAMLVSML